jgi:hypothetical protein
LTVPVHWETARTVVWGPGGDEECMATPVTDCPKVIRYFLVDAAQIDAYRDAEAAVAGAGFAIDEPFDPTCLELDFCAFRALREAVELQVNVNPPGKGDGGVADPDRVTIRIIALESHRAEGRP